MEEDARVLAARLATADPLPRGPGGANAGGANSHLPVVGDLHEQTGGRGGGKARRRGGARGDQWRRRKAAGRVKRGRRGHQRGNSWGGGFGKETLEVTRKAAVAELLREGHGEAGAAKRRDYVAQRAAGASRETGR